MNDDAIERNQAKDDQNIHTEKVERESKCAYAVEYY